MNGHPLSVLSAALADAFERELNRQDEEADRTAEAARASRRRLERLANNREAADLTPQSDTGVSAA